MLFASAFRQCFSPVLFAVEGLVPHTAAMSGSPEGPWICCPWCSDEILLSLFAPSDEEPDAAVAVCRGCHRRVLLSDGPGHPS